MSDEILNQILKNQEIGTNERRDQGLMLAEIRTVLLGTKEPITPGLVQNFNAFREKTSGRLGRLEKGALISMLGLGGAGGTTAYWENIKHMIGL